MPVPLWFHLHLNPERWAVGQLGIGRSKTKKIFPTISPDQQLQSFQKAVKEQLLVFANETMLPMMEPGLYDIAFWFWRRKESYQGKTRKVVKNPVDLTNLQKGLEDGLQKILFDNDRNVRHIESTLVEQEVDTQPLIVIRATYWTGFNHAEFPEWLWDRIEEARRPIIEDDPPNYTQAEELF